MSTSHFPWLQVIFHDSSKRISQLGYNYWLPRQVSSDLLAVERYKCDAMFSRVKLSIREPGCAVQVNVLSNMFINIPSPSFYQLQSVECPPDPCLRHLAFFLLGLCWTLYKSINPSHLCEPTASPSIYDIFLNLCHLYEPLSLLFINLCLLYQPQSTP